MDKLKKSVAAALCAVIVFALFFSLIFLITESGHECCGEECAVCREMRACAEILSGFASVLPAVAVGTVLRFFLHFSLRKAVVTSGNLVAMKVKLTN